MDPTVATENVNPIHNGQNNHTKESETLKFLKDKQFNDYQIKLH